MLFPVHPRTLRNLEAAGDDARLRDAGVIVTEPLGYLDFLCLEADAAFVVTDSGGVQEETTALGVRCFTLRDSTERRVTEELGTNTVLGAKPERLAEIPRLLERPKPGEVVPGWDGAAGGRAAEVIGSTLARELVEMEAVVTLVDSLVPEYGGLLFNIAGIEDRVRVNISDVRDEHSLRYLVRDQDVLFNLAGQTSHLDSMTDPYTDLEINARSQLSILEAARHENPDVTIVFASTRQIYGRPSRLPVDEQHPVVPVDVNGINKAAGEWYHLLYGDVYGIRTSVLRLTNTYGPRMRVRDARQTFLGTWVKHALEDADVILYGDGKPAP